MRRMAWIAASVVLLFPSPAGAEDLANRTYKRLWERADRFYGQEGRPPPVFRRAEPGTMGSLLTVRGPTGTPPVVYAKPWIRRHLAGKGTDNTQRHNSVKRSAEKALLHEWAHAFQAPEVFDDEATAERGAAQFARAIAPQLLRPKEKREKRKYDPWRDSLQFGQSVKQPVAKQQARRIKRAKP